MSDWNQSIIEEFRANDGVVATGGFGSGLVLLHTTGAKSGEARITPVAGFPDGGSWIVVASKAGATTHPAWYFNLVAHPEVAIEVAGESGVIDVTATETSGADYDAVWSMVTTKSPGFAEYKKTAGGRVIPLLRLSRR